MPEIQELYFVEEITMLSHYQMILHQKVNALVSANW